MTIERSSFNGPISFLCDGPRCHEYIETRCENFHGALAKMKRSAWSVRKTGGEWQHFCTECSERQ